MKTKYDNTDYNEKGVTPAIGMPASGSAESTTKSTISESTIEIRDKENQKQDLAGLNCDAKNSLNKLGEIFDRTVVKDRMALADEFGKLAYKAAGDLAQVKGWKDGSKEKNTLHAIVGGIMSKLGNDSFMSGASAGLINEMVQEELAKAFEKNTGMHELASALLGEVASKAAGGNIGVGASVTNSATKNNYLTHEQLKKYNDEIEDIEKNPMLTEKEKKKAKEEVDFKYNIISALQNREWLEKNKDRGERVIDKDGVSVWTGIEETVGFDKNGNKVTLTTGEMIVYDRKFTEVLDSIKSGDKIKFSDGSIYYVQPNGELCKEDSIGALMPYKEISLKDHSVTSKRESFTGDDTTISDDHHEKAGQYVYDSIGNIIEMSTGLNLISESIKKPC